MLHRKRELIAYQLDKQEAPNLSNNSGHLNCKLNRILETEQYKLYSLIRL